MIALLPLKLLLTKFGKNNKYMQADPASWAADAGH